MEMKRNKSIALILLLTMLLTLWTPVTSFGAVTPAYEEDFNSAALGAFPVSAGKPSENWTTEVSGLTAATKEKEPDIGIWQIEQSELDACMEIIRPKIQRYALLKIGIGEPERCEKCDFCKHTKKLTKIMSSEEMYYE